MTSVVVYIVVVVVGVTVSTIVVKEESVPAIHSDRVMTAMYVHLVWSIRNFHTFVYENQMQCSPHTSNLWESNNMFELIGILNCEYPYAAGADLERLQRGS